jgi:U3 small nucleolar ribonucleoprotein protein IMP3
MHLTLSQAVKFIEQGHIRVGPDTVTDPAFMITRYVGQLYLYCPGPNSNTERHMEDFVTWVDTSKLKKTVMKYNDEVSTIVKLTNTLFNWTFSAG